MTGRRVRRGGAVCAALVAALSLIVGAVAMGQARQPQTARTPIGTVLGRHQARGAMRPSATVRVVHRAEGVRGHTLAALRSRWPVRGPINSDFGARRWSWRHRAHRGIDIGAARGTPVRVPAAGTVVFAGWRNGYGRTIIIDHGDRVHTLYGHLSRLGVRRGQTVRQGTAIGSTGSTGHASGPHLHYEILVRSRPVNPGHHAR
jgi:murein DD-endopeptidase MepM/ murein hydrolase activator NlpD